MNKTGKKKFTDTDFFYNSYYFAHEVLMNQKLRHPTNGISKLAFKKGKISYRGRRQLQKLVDDAKIDTKTILLHSSYSIHLFSGNREQPF